MCDQPLQAPPTSPRIACIQGPTHPATIRAVPFFWRRKKENNPCLLIVRWRQKRSNRVYQHQHTSSPCCCRCCLRPPLHLHTPWKRTDLLCWLPPPMLPERPERPPTTHLRGCSPPPPNHLAPPRHRTTGGGDAGVAVVGSAKNMRARLPTLVLGAVAGRTRRERTRSPVTRWQSSRRAWCSA